MNGIFNEMEWNGMEGMEWNEGMKWNQLRNERFQTVQLSWVEHCEYLWEE